MLRQKCNGSMGMGGAALDGVAQESPSEEVAFNLSPKPLTGSQLCEHSETIAALFLDWVIAGRYQTSLIPFADLVWEDARLPAGLWGDPADGCALDVREWHR